MCATNEYFNGATGVCVKNTTTMADTKSGLPFYGYIGDILAGGGALAAGLKGTSNAPTTNIYGDPNQNRNQGNILLYVGIGLVLLIVLFVAMKK